MKNNDIVLIKLNRSDPNCYKNRVKSVGGQWNPHRRGWELPMGEVRQLGLIHRIYKNPKNTVPQKRKYEQLLLFTEDFIN